MKRFAALLVLLALAGGGQGGAQTPLLDPADAAPFDVGGPSGRCYPPTSMTTVISIS